MARTQHNPGNLKSLSEIDFHPLFFVLLLCDRSVIAKLRLLDNFGLRLEFRNLFLEFRQLWTAQLGDFPRGFCLLLSQFRQARIELVALVFNVGMQIVSTICAVNCGKQRLQSVVVLLCDRIEFVVVAASALNGHTAECIQRIGHHVIAVEIASHLAVNLCLRDFHVTDVIPRASGDETES